VIKFKDLDIINAIAETGSISLACDKLNMHQSNLSKYLSNLENKYGITLFKRGYRCLQLTPLGCELMPVIIDCLNKREELHTILKRYETHREGPVNIYAQKNILHYIAKHIIHKLKNTEDILITLNNHDDYRRELFPEDADIVISHYPHEKESLSRNSFFLNGYTAFATSSNLNKFTTGDNSIIAISHPLVERFKAKINDSLEGRVLWKYDCDDFTSAVSLASNSLGVLIAPDFFFYAGLKEIDLLDNHKQIMGINPGLFIIFKRKKYQIKHVKHLINELSDAIQKNANELIYKI
jgi:DNA-binding transcriptional LysR family regulator